MKKMAQNLRGLSSSARFQPLLALFSIARQAGADGIALVE